MRCSQVNANNRFGDSDEARRSSFTYPLPPIPVVNSADVGNVTVRVHLDLMRSHDLLNISLEVIAIH